jgi:hypothetical protein
MKNQDYTMAIRVDKTPKQVFDAIINIRGWWSENVEGDVDKLNNEWLYYYKDAHRAIFQTTELVPGQRVVWHVKENYFNFTKDAAEWTDTKLVFDISEKNGKTELRFTHQGLEPHYECFDVCSEAWTHFIKESLRGLIESGTGDPSPRDEKGFNADLIEKWKLEKQR